MIKYYGSKVSLFPFAVKSLEKYLSAEFLERSSSNSNSKADIILSGMHDSVLRSVMTFISNLPLKSSFDAPYNLLFSDFS